MKAQKIKLNYPEDAYDVFVVADNCTDNTAEISRQHGAQAFERFNTELRGKGHALDWMFEKIFEMEDKLSDAIQRLPVVEQEIIIGSYMRQKSDIQLSRELFYNADYIRQVRTKAIHHLADK